MRDPDYDLHKFAAAAADEDRLAASLAEQEVLRQAGNLTRLALDRRLLEIMGSGEMTTSAGQTAVSPADYQLPIAIAAE